MTQLAVLSDDPLGPWLESLKPSTAVFCRATVRSPWGFRIEARDESTFHILTRGSALLEVEGVDEPIELSQGDLALLAGGAAHQLRDDPSSTVRPLEEAVAGGTADGKHFQFGGDDATSTNDATAVMVCGGCRLGAAGARSSSALLPAVIRHRCEPALVRLLERESRALASGGEAVLSQILGLLVTQALRAHLAEREGSGRSALLAPSLAEALAFLHDHLHRDIGLDDLCAAANLSRTTLSDRFQETLGVSPIRYLRLTRLARAAELLRNGGSGLEKIARAVGYSSASTLSRAFRREYDMSPGEYRTRR